MPPARLAAIAIVLAIASFVPDAAVAQSPNANGASISTAINKSGRMRMLSQRIVKVYAQSTHGIVLDRALEIRMVSIREMSQGLDELKKVQPNAEIKATYAALDAKTRPFLAAAGGAADPKQLASLNAQADEVLELANRLAGLYEQAGKSASAKLINVAGRQRMLSQRMAKNYLLLQAGVPGVSAGDIARDQREFTAALAMLKGAPLSNSAIKQDLELADVQWVFFENAIAVQSKDRGALQNVATTSERLLEVMDDLTLQYDQALKDLLG